MKLIFTVVIMTIAIFCLCSCIVAKRADEWLQNHEKDFDNKK